MHPSVNCRVLSAAARLASRAAAYFLLGAVVSLLLASVGAHFDRARWTQPSNKEIFGYMPDRANGGRIWEVRLGWIQKIARTYPADLASINQRVAAPEPGDRPAAVANQPPSWTAASEIGPDIGAPVTLWVDRAFGWPWPVLANRALHRPATPDEAVRLTALSQPLIGKLGEFNTGDDIGFYVYGGTMPQWYDQLFGPTGSGALAPRVLLTGLVFNALTIGAILAVLTNLHPTARLILASHRRRRGKCERCGYDLRGLAGGACPECGGGGGRALVGGGDAAAR